MLLHPSAVAAVRLQQASIPMDGRIPMDGHILAGASWSVLC